MIIFWLPRPCLAQIHVVLLILPFHASLVSLVLVLWLLLFFSAGFLSEGPLRVFELRASSRELHKIQQQENPVTWLDHKSNPGTGAADLMRYDELSGVR